MLKLKSMITPIKKLLPTFVYKYLNDWTNESIIKTVRLGTLILIQFLIKDSEHRYNSCNDIICWDKPGKLYRFTIVYILHSLNYNTRISILIQTNELKPIFSITNLFYSTYWSEREIWDLFGVFIIRNHDLRRILTDYGFTGHPLRKDFPLTGFVESTYDDLQKRLETTKVELTQAYRIFKYPLRWSHEYYSN